MSLYPFTKDIRKALIDAGEAEDAIQMQKYMRSDIPFHGVRSAEQKKICNTNFKKYPPKELVEYLNVIQELWSGKFREEKYTAIHYAKRFKTFHRMEALPLFREMIETGAWWDFVDSIAKDLVGSLLKQFPVQVKSLLNDWIVDENLWIRRSAILAQLSFKEDTDHEMLFEFCNKCLHEKSFWIRKAIGWALRDYSKSAQQKVREYVEENQGNMSGVTLREAVKYI